MSRRILLLYNTPKARTYFRAVRDNIPELDIQVQPILLRPGPALPPAKRTWLAAYGVTRKRAREHIGPRRQRLWKAILERFAHWHYHSAAARIRRLAPDAVGVWGGQSVDTRAALAAADDLGVPRYTFECGLLPNTTTCDPRGVNFDNSVPRDPAFYAGRDTSAALPESLLPRASKHDDAAITLPDKYIFIPFQVRLDSQILLYSPWIRQMRQLFDAVTAAARQALPAGELKLVFKLHPSCVERYPELQASADANILFANGNPTEELIRCAQGVITVNSTVGIEALLLDRPVLTVGQACYAIPGVAGHAGSVDEIAAWMRALQAQTLPAAEHRLAFLSYLAQDYCIPDHHKRLTPAHFVALRKRLSQHPGPTTLPAPS